MSTILETFNEYQYCDSKKKFVAYCRFLKYENRRNSSGNVTTANIIMDCGGKLRKEKCKILGKAFYKILPSYTMKNCNF